MIKFNVEIVIVIILVFGVYYLYEQNMYLKSKILQCTDAERDTKETLDYINKDLLNIKRTLQEGQGTRQSGGVRPRVSFQEPPTVVPVVTVTPPTETTNGLSELNERVVGDSLRNLGNILGRLPRGTVSRSSFSMNVPSSMLNSLNRGGGGDMENEIDDQSLDLEEPTPTDTPTKTI